MMETYGKYAVIRHPDFFEVIDLSDNHKFVFASRSRAAAHKMAEKLSKKGEPMQQTLKIICKEVVVFNDNQIGIYDGFNNIGLGVQVGALVSVEPVSDQEVELHVRIPLGHEVPDLLDEIKWDIY